MRHTDSPPEVTCTLTEEQEAERSAAVRERLIAHYLGSKDSEDGLEIRFHGTTESLRALAEFTANEVQCCSFAEYGISMSPPYDETVLTITGPEGTRQIFHEGLVEKLEEASNAGRLSG